MNARQINSIIDRVLAHPLTAAMPIIGWVALATAAWQRFREWRSARGA